MYLFFVMSKILNLSCSFVGLLYTRATVTQSTTYIPKPYAHVLLIPKTKESQKDWIGCTQRIFFAKACALFGEKGCAGYVL